MRRRLAVVAALMLVPAPVGPATEWTLPVDGPVVRSFGPPAERFGRGHRGVDFAVAPGTAVRAAGAGLVVFAGPVAGGRHVVVSHPGGLRTGYSYLSRISVAQGEPVARGTVVGSSGGTGPAHEPGVLHFSLREGSAYADPMRLFGRAPVVRLAPVDRPGPRVCPAPAGKEKGPGPAATLTADPAIRRESSRPHSHR